MTVQQFDGGPAQLVLTASVARRYYVDGRSKVDIADEFGLSRFKVARLLDSARSSGLVRIEIGYSGVLDIDLSGRLQDRFGLQHALVVDTSDEHGPSLRRVLGQAAADLLSEIVTEQDVLGVAWARAVSAMVGSLVRLACTPVVQLTGVLPQPDVDENALELVRGVVKVSGGPAYLFYAPLIVADAATARSLRGQPEVRRAFDHFASVTKAVVGLGLWAPGQSTLYDALDDRTREQMHRQGVLADISGVFVGASGQPIAGRAASRMIAIDAEQMRAIPEVIAIAYGVAKAPAVAAALRGGLVTGLVTHTALAQALLEDR